MKHFNKALISFIFIALFSFPIYSNEPIPFEYDQYGRILVPIEIGSDNIYPFLLDTASRRFSITDELLPQSHIKRHDHRTIRHMSSAGMYNLPLATLKQVSFGQNAREARIAAIFPKSRQIMGSAGFDAYHGYILHINPMHKQIELHANSGAFANADWQLITGNPNQYGGLLLETTYKGHNLTVVLASGLSTSILDIQAASALFPNRVNKNHVLPGKEDGVVDLQMGLNQKRYLEKTIVLEDFSIKDWHLGNLSVAIRGLSTQNKTGYTNSMLLMLGADVLAKTEMAIDGRSHQLWISPNKN